VTLSVFIVLQSSRSAASVDHHLGRRDRLSEKWTRSRYRETFRSPSGIRTMRRLYIEQSSARCRSVVAEGSTTSEARELPRGAVDDCQKFASRLVGGYPVTRALPEISRGWEKNDKAGWSIPRACVRACTRACVRACRWGLSEKSGPRRAAVRRGTEAQPLRQGRSKTSKHPWQGVLRLYLVTVSSPERTHAAMA